MLLGSQVISQVTLQSDFIKWPCQLPSDPAKWPCQVTLPSDPVKWPSKVSLSGDPDTSNVKWSHNKTMWNILLILSAVEGKPAHFAIFFQFSVFWCYINELIQEKSHICVQIVVKLLRFLIFDVTSMISYRRKVIWLSKLWWNFWNFWCYINELIQEKNHICV